MLSCTGASGTMSASAPPVTVNPSILSMLSPTKIATIGSTVDPIERGGNPYGLAIAAATAGLVTKGDLIVCNFNDGATNTEGLGTTVIGFVGQPVQLDSSGTPGALFGIAATVDSEGNQIIYFNEDNTNTVMALTK